MLPEETVRRIEVGQFWACLRPLGLLRIDTVGDNAMGQLGVGGYYWEPKDYGDRVYFEFKPKYHRYLWFNAMIPKELLIDDAQVGDVWLIRANPYPIKTIQNTGIGNVMIESEDEPLLIFIGPDSDEKYVHVLASWEVMVTNGLRLAHLYQPGPGRRSPPPKSCYEHLRNPGL